MGQYMAGAVARVYTGSGKEPQQQNALFAILTIIIGLRSIIQREFYDKHLIFVNVECSSLLTAREKLSLHVGYVISQTVGLGLSLQRRRHIFSRPQEPQKHITPSFVAGTVKQCLVCIVSRFFNI